MLVEPPVPLVNETIICVGTAACWLLDFLTSNLLIKSLIYAKNILGGTAVSCLLNILGDDFKEEALVLLVENCDDYNFCSTVARSLKNYITEDDLPKLILDCNKVQEKLNSGNIKEFEAKFA